MRAMRQKDQSELNLGTGAKGEALKTAAQEIEARAAKPVSKVRRSQGRRWKQYVL